MTRKTITISLAVAALALALLWLVLQPVPDTNAVAPVPAAIAPPAARRTDGDVRLAAPNAVPDGAPDGERSAAPNAGAANAAQVVPRPMGSVIVRVVDEDSGKPRTDVEVTLVPLGRGGLCFRSASRCDPQGVARFEHVEVGPVIALGDRSGRIEGDVREDAVTELQLALPRGCNVEGRVVDTNGRPVSQPEVWLYDAGRYLRIAECDANAYFRIEDVQPGCYLTGIARDATSSNLVQVEGGPGETMHADIVVDQPSAILLGQVLDATERPVAGAIVGITAPEPGIQFLGGGYRTTATDNEGRFTLGGVIGEQVLIVRTQTFEPSVTQIVCTPGQRVEHIVRLRAGAILIGRTSFADGTPAAHSIVQVGDLLDEMLGAVAISDERGEFRATGLAPGQQTVRARCGNGDDAQQDLVLAAGRATVWNPVVPWPDGEAPTSR